EAYQKAETDEEKEKVFQGKYPQPGKLAPKFLELAEKYPKDPVAFDALAWVVSNVSGTAGGKEGPRAKAVALLARDHVTSEKIGPVCQRLANGYDKEGEGLLRAVLDKNPHSDVQGEACLALGQRLGMVAEVVRHLKDHPDDAERYGSAFGKEYVAELQK